MKNAKSNDHEDEYFVGADSELSDEDKPHESVKAIV